MKYHIEGFEEIYSIFPFFFFYKKKKKKKKKKK